MNVMLPARILTLTAAIAAAAPGAVPARWRAVDAGAARELALASDVRLEGQRAGALEKQAPLSQGELSALDRAQGAAVGLEEQRGGDVHFTDREVQIILWTAAVIAVILLIT